VRDNDDLVIYNFAIIISLFQGQWVWVRNKNRSTWELPAGHLEPGETALEAAHRELFEETGALKYTIHPIVSYEGILDGIQVFGKIFLARITELGPLPDFEISEIHFFYGIPVPLTYPQTQPVFFNYVQSIIF